MQAFTEEQSRSIEHPCHRRRSSRPLWWHRRDAFQTAADAQHFAGDERCGRTAQEQDATGHVERLTRAAEGDGLADAFDHLLLGDAESYSPLGYIALIELGVHGAR